MGRKAATADTPISVVAVVAASFTEYAAGVASMVVLRTPPLVVVLPFMVPVGVGHGEVVAKLVMEAIGTAGTAGVPP